MKKIKTTLLAALMVISTQAVTQQTTVGKIINVQANPNGFSIQMDPQVPKDECANAGFAVSNASHSEAALNRIYSLALTAMASNMNVSLVTAFGCNGNNYPHIYSLDLLEQ